MSFYTLGIPTESTYHQALLIFFDMQPMVGANVGHLDISQIRGDAALRLSCSSSLVVLSLQPFFLMQCWNFSFIL